MADGAGSGGDSGPPPGPAPPSESRNLQTPLVLPRPASFQLDWRDIVRETDFSTGRPRKLGSGAFGVVYAAKLKRDMDTLVALKILQWSGDEGLRRKQHESFSREVEVWQTLTDDHVLRFLGYTVDPYLTLVSEVAETDLASLLQGPPRPTFPWVDAQRCLLHVALGMRHLHSKDIVHCDLKPANILRRNGIYKVADFGLSAFRDSALGGTRGYLAPEALFQDVGPRELPSDVYSYGIVAYELNAGQCPDLPGSLAYRSGSPLRRPFGITDAVWNLIESCTDWQPLDRPDFRAIVAVVEALSRLASEPGPDVLQSGNDWSLSCALTETAAAMYSTSERDGSSASCLQGMFQLHEPDITYDTSIVLGQNSFLTVYRGGLHGFGDSAIKVFRSWCHKDYVNELLKAEFEVSWGKLPAHENVVPFFGFCTSPPLVVTEFCAGGNLSQFMARHDWHTHLGFRLLANAATGITFLHSKDIIHGGLKPENILIDDSFGYPVAKVSDYCMPQIFTKLATHDTFEPEFQHGEDFDIAYASPESITGERLPKASDVWSFGMVCWHVQAHGQRPYGPRPGFPIVQAIRRGQCPPRPYRTTDAVWSLIQSCWSLETERRPTMAAVTAELIRLRDT